MTMPHTEKGCEVSVVVLTYGDFTRLGQTLESVLKQDFLGRTVIVSDDGSGKAFPPEVIEQYPDAIFRQNEHNLGTVAHMNAVARMTDRAYIKFLSAGDAFSDTGALSALVEFAKAEGTVVVTSQAQVCDESLCHPRYLFPGTRRGRVFQKDAAALFQTLATVNLVSAVGTLFSLRFFTELGGFDEEYRLLEDWPAWLHLTREGHRLPLLNRVTCLYRVGGVSSAHSDAFCAPKLQKDMLHCYEKEILPYQNLFRASTMRKIAYGYDQLRGVSPNVLLKTYGYLERKTRWKRRIKQWMFRH